MAEGKNEAKPLLIEIFLFHYYVKKSGLRNKIEENNRTEFIFRLSDNTILRSCPTGVCKNSLYRPEAIDTAFISLPKQQDMKTRRLIDVKLYTFLTSEEDTISVELHAVADYIPLRVDSTGHGPCGPEQH